VVLVSAAAGLPPLAVVAVVAGLRRTPLVAFTVAVLVGRLARFGALAWPVVAIAS
jgi:membrane protein YqaA with SNARE-associated domain